MVASEATRQPGLAHAALALGGFAIGYVQRMQHAQGLAQSLSLALGHRIRTPRKAAGFTSIRFSAEIAPAATREITSRRWVPRCPVSAPLVSARIWRGDRPSLTHRDDPDMCLAGNMIDEITYRSCVDGCSTLHKLKVGRRDPITEEHLRKPFATQTRTPRQSFEMG
jgi:hypothetical protein